jgi:hypothetical protein
VKLAKQMRRWGGISFLVMAAGYIVFFIVMMTTMPYGGYNFDELPVIARYSLLVGLALTAPTLILIIGSNAARVRANRALQKTGLQADARILNVKDTGTRINRSPVVRLMLEVRPPNQPAFEAETERLLSILDITHLQPGNVIQVKYDPDTHEVAIANSKR